MIVVQERTIVDAPEVLHQNIQCIAPDRNPEINGFLAKSPVEDTHPLSIDKHLSEVAHMIDCQGSCLRTRKNCSVQYKPVSLSELFECHWPITGDGGRKIVEE